MVEFQFDPLPRDVGQQQDPLTELQTSIPRTLAIRVPNGRQLFPPPDEDAEPAGLLLISSGTVRFGSDPDDIDRSNEPNEDTEVDESNHLTVQLRLRVDQQIGTDAVAGAAAFGALGNVFLPLDNSSGAATDAAGAERRPVAAGGFDMWFLEDVFAYGDPDLVGGGQLNRMGYQTSVLVQTPVTPRERQTEVGRSIPIS